MLGSPPGHPSARQHHPGRTLRPPPGPARRRRRAGTERGWQPHPLSNDLLRYDLYPKGTTRAGGTTDEDPFLTAQNQLRDAVKALDSAVDALDPVRDADDNPVVEMQGLPADAKTWRKQLTDVAERLTDWYAIGVEHRATQAAQQARTRQDAGAENEGAENDSADGGTSAA